MKIKEKKYFVARDNSPPLIYAFHNNQKIKNEKTFCVKHLNFLPNNSY